MPLVHQRYNARFVENAKTSSEPIVPEVKYQVRTVKADVAEGETYWRLVGVHHLLPDENVSKHNIYIEALDEKGARIKNPIAWAGWTWEGRRPNERADPVALDKPDSETAGDIAIHFGQKASIWIKGLNRDANDKSDRVENLHTAHADEPLPDGRLLNTIGHHSFYVVFQRTRKQAQATGTPSTPTAPPPPPPPPPPSTPTTPTTPTTPSTPTIPTTPSTPPPAAAKTIAYYLLFGPSGSRGRQTNLLLATNYILAFSPTIGFSVAEAKQARQVTIIGEGISPADQQAIQSSGTQVELLSGDPYTLEAKLTERIRTGRAFGG